MTSEITARLRCITYCYLCAIQWDPGLDKLPLPRLLDNTDEVIWRIQWGNADGMIA